MKDIQRVETILERMAALFRIGELNDWAIVFDGLHKQIKADPVNTILKIRGSYGGMGSLNDIVLHKNGIPLTKENDEFDALNTELYNLCRANS